VAVPAPSSEVRESLFQWEGPWPATSKDGDSPWRLYLEMNVVDGRLECTRFSMWMGATEAGKPVTTTAVRGVPLGSLVSGAAQHAQEIANRNAPWVEVVEKIPSEPRPKGRPPKYDLEHWKSVAATYRAAGGRSPTQAVVDKFGVPRQTAGGWVRRCRELQLLGPTDERRPGERETKSRAKKRKGTR
jgi:hypothetical protein